MQKTNENGEFVRIYLGDSKESYALTTWGGIVPITRKVVLNDDLQALTRIPAGLGIAAATLESDTVWAVITANANMADGLPLFHATHKNLTATNGLAAVANITAARKAMRKQTAPKGTILNLIPKYLIIPAALEGIAVQITNPDQPGGNRIFRRCARVRARHGADRGTALGRGGERRRHELVHGGRPELD